MSHTHRFYNINALDLSIHGPLLWHEEVDMAQYGIAEFVGDVRAATAGLRDESAIVERAKPLVLRLARSPSWVGPGLYECDAEQGFGVRVLHEEPGDGLWLVAVAWMAHRGAPPPNHGTWAVIAGIDGEEKNVVWKRRGERLESQATEIIGPMQVTAFLSNAIHSVANDSDRTTLSLHLYGRNLNHAERSRFDPATGAETPFKLQVR